MQLEQVGAETCDRNLKPGQVKRHPLKGPRFYGYKVACPDCGAAALWDNEPGFVETDERLVATTNPMRCWGCRRDIRIGDGEITTH